MNYSHIKKALLVVVIFLTTYSISAQDELSDEYGNHYGYHRSPIYYPQRDAEDAEDDPGTGEEGGGTVEDPETPIDGNLLYLAIAGIAAAGLYFYRGHRISSLKCILR
jgi:hypothetical protein